MSEDVEAFRKALSDLKSAVRDALVDPSVERISLAINWIEDRLS